MANQCVAKAQVSSAFTLGSGDGWNATISACVIIVIVQSVSVPTITDSASNTYTLIATIGNLRMFATATSVAVTSISSSGAGNITVIAIEDDSISTASYSDGNNTNSQATVGVWNTTSVTTTNANDVAYATMYLANATSTIAVNSPFTAMSGTGLTSGYIQSTSSTATIFVGTNTYTSTGTYSASGTDNQGSSTHRSIIAFFKQTSGPPPTPTPLSLMQNLGYNTFYVQDH